MNLKRDFTIRPKMSVLAEEEIDFFYGGALEVMERLGVRVLHPEALKLLEGAGASVGPEGIVKIRPSLVEKAIRSAPKRVFIYDREGNPAMELGGRNTGGQNTYYGTGSDLKNTYDPDTREYRQTLSRDIANMAKVADYLPNLDFLMSAGIPFDARLDQIYRTEFLEMVSHSTKPIVFTSDNGADTRRIIDMAAVVSGGMGALRLKPYVINYSQPTSPLQHSEDALGKVFACAEAGIPVVYPPGMIPGATAPTTTAGVITQSIAESLSALVMHQLKQEGAPIILCGAHGWLDMKSAINVYAAPGRLMTQAALSAFYQHFGLPTWGFGGCTDAQLLDQQAGMEFALLNLWAALCGINLAHDTAYVGSGLIGCLSSLVLNDEIIGYVRHVLCRGALVNKETQAIEVLERVGPGGNFLTDAHTFRHFKEEFWRPYLLNTDRYEVWKDKGAKTAGDRADQKVREILKNHVPKPLQQGILDELERMRQA